MMKGSFFVNCWAALVVFCLYFFMALYNNQAPQMIMIGAIVASIIIFFLTFVVRYLWGYILLNQEGELVQCNSVSAAPNEQVSEAEIDVLEKQSPEKIAKVIQTVMDE